MNLADSSTCLFCNKEKTVVHAFLECGNVTRFWRKIESWIRGLVKCLASLWVNFYSSVFLLLCFCLTIEPIQSTYCLKGLLMRNT